MLLGIERVKTCPEDRCVVPETVYKVGGVLMDVDLQEEPHQLYQLDLCLCHLLVA